MPLLTLPLALLGLAALPAAVAIYWLRNRLTRQEVSSLHLWMGQREAREGGKRVQRLQLPWLLMLELLALLLLVLAATDPRVLMGQQQRQLVVVLDDSYSMQAGARALAAEALSRQIGRENPLALRLVLAREEPRVLSSLLTTPGQVNEALTGWRCQSAGADLDRAIALAYELGGEQGRVLVLTDHLPRMTGDQPRLVWQALGKPAPNVAIINAVRAPAEQGGRVLFEVANLSPQTVSTQFRVNDSVTTLNLAPREVRRLWMEGKDPATTLSAQLQEDALGQDNNALLLPGLPPPVRVKMNVGDQTLRDMLTKAVAAFGGGKLVDDHADMLMTDRAGTTLSSPEMWLTRWQVEEGSVAFVGPFLMDEQHPLMQGLELEGVVWGAKQAPMPGRTILAAGNTPLVSVVDRSGPSGAQFDVEIRLNPQQSTIGATPAFPVLVWNLLAWRRAALPGLVQPNVRLGAQATLTLPYAMQAHDSHVKIISPDGQSREVAVHDASLLITADQPGVYEIIADQQHFDLAANTMSQQESDLSNLATQTLGDWATVATLRTQYTSIAWLLLLAAMGVLTLHSYLTWRGAGGGR